MIITKKQAYTKDEVEKLKEVFGTYIKTVIDVEKRICSSGCDRHFESEKILLDSGSSQRNIWGGGIDLETKMIDFNSFINIRPNDNNESSEILDPKIKAMYKELTKFFFKNIYEK